MVIVNVNSKASDIIRQLFELAKREKDGVLINDSTGEIYTISKVRQVGLLEDTPAGILENIKKNIEEKCEPVYPQYQEQLSSEEFRERMRDPGAENNYNIDKFIEETEQLYGEYQKSQQEVNDDSEEKPLDEEKVNVVELLEKLIPEDECMSDEEFEETEREYEEYMKRKQAEEAAQKTKKRGRPKKNKEPKSLF